VAGYVPLCSLVRVYGFDGSVQLTTHFSCKCTARVEELQSIEVELRDELDQQHLEAEEAIGIWEHQCKDLEAQLEDELQRGSAHSTDPSAHSTVSAAQGVDLATREASEEAKKTAEDKIRALEKKLSETEAAFTSHIEGAEADQTRAKTSDGVQRLHDREKLDELDRRNEELRSSRAALEAQVDKLKIHVAEQNHEIRNLHDSLRLHETNEVSDRAAKMAAEALTREVEELQHHRDDAEKSLETECTRRLMAEGEARRLRSDMAALLGMENTEENQSEICRRIMEATEHFQRKEQAEIEDLRESLSQALDNLDSVREELQLAEDRAMRVELEFSTVEESLVSSQRELKFMDMSMKEFKDTEASCRISLDSRISSLESDLIVVRRFHASEMESLRNGLNQMTAERERLAYTLEEAECSKFAVLEALSSKENAGDNHDPEARRLRLENTNLLLQIAEETARTERRIRETLSADRSASQTQVLVERELRLASDRALKIAHEELARARQDTSARHSSSSEGLEELTKTLDVCQERNQKLEQQLADVTRQLETIRSESRRQTEHLQEECRQAKSRINLMERDGRYEAEVRAEMARIQAFPVNREALQLLASRSDESDEDEYEQISVARFYDMIDKQRRQMDEERKLHLELKQEFDDLLALLAQKDMVSSSLSKALASVGGDGAVQQALEEAESGAVAKYGKAVRVETFDAQSDS
jgi:hypothetical protein